MRLDLPREPEIPLKRDREIASDARKPESQPLPVSIVGENLKRLQRPLETGPARTIPPIPRIDKERDLAPDRLRRNREPERRPRRTRDGIAIDIRGVSLRPEERKLLAEAGRFRVLNIQDVSSSIYQGDERALRTDLDYLKKHGLIALDSVAPRNDGRWQTRPRIEVVTLTKEGERIAHETGNFSLDQKLYHGLVKPREVEHDSQIYRAYLKETERIEKSGGSNPRVELDFELKSKVQKAIYAARKIDPDRDMDEIKREVAGQYELPYVHNKIEIPDARIHYDTDQGAHTAFSDIEVVTAAYRPDHMQAKAQAGFHMYASASDHSRLSKIEDEHHMLDWVMDL
jgi:hypothetical protein